MDKDIKMEPSTDYIPTPCGDTKQDISVRLSNEELTHPGTKANTRFEDVYKREISPENHDYTAALQNLVKTEILSDMDCLSSGPHAEMEETTKGETCVKIEKRDMEEETVGEPCDVDRDDQSCKTIYDDSIPSHGSGSEVMGVTDKSDEDCCVESCDTLMGRILKEESSVEIDVDGMTNNYLEGSSNRVKDKYVTTLGKLSTTQHSSVEKRKRKESSKISHYHKLSTTPSVLESNTGIETADNAFESYKCVTCGKEFATTSLLHQHTITHTREPYKCLTYENLFTHYSLLNKHCIIHTNKKPPKFPTKELYKCTHCEKSFYWWSSLKTHIKIHTGENLYKCLTCGKAFSLKSHLKTHSKIHTGEKSHECLTCGKTFLQNSHLKVHSKIHTGEKPYECLTCGKTFLQNSHLKVHSKIHTGEKPYKCLICGKAFLLKSNLKTHSKIHTGEKSYECLTCGKAFLQNSSLKAHQKIHTGEKPYNCLTCGKAFSLNSNLKRHQQIHTGEMS